MPRRSLVLVPLLALWAVAAVADSNVDLPVATQGTEQWAGVVAKAMSAGGKNQDESLQALSSFQEKVFSKIAKTVGLSALSAPPCVTQQDLVIMWRAVLTHPPTQWEAIAGLVQAGRHFNGELSHALSVSGACPPSQVCAAMLTTSAMRVQSKEFDALKSGDAAGFLSEVMSNAVSM